MKKTGFYIIKDSFFDDMDEPYLKGNKKGNRPHYYCFEDSASGLYWMIPLSSRIDKYKKIVENKKKAGKPCDIIHIVKLDDDRESAFLLQDMFPITDAYVEREYTIAGNHRCKPVKIRGTAIFFKNCQRWDFDSSCKHHKNQIK